MHENNKHWLGGGGRRNKPAEVRSVDTSGIDRSIGSNRDKTEDGNSMFLRNVGIYLRVYTASQPRSTTS
jgi:hypothetical protein